MVVPARLRRPINDISSYESLAGQHSRQVQGP
jgi:hypothetical protein